MRFLIAVVPLMLMGQTTPTPAPASALPSDAVFLGVADGNGFYPTFGYARLLTSSMGGLYSYSQNIVTSAKLRPFAITDHTQSGLATPAKTFPKIRLSFWAFGAPGVSSTSTATGFSWSYGGFGLWAPWKKYPEWHLCAGWEAVDSTVSTGQKAPFAAVVWAK